MMSVTKTYTYRGGVKIPLEKSAEQIVVRALPDELDDNAILEMNQVSSRSTRLRVASTELEPLMARTRNVAPTHHAYREADTGAEFLITDRIFVTFHEILSDEEVDRFAASYGLVTQQRYGERDYLFQLTEHTGMNPVKLVVKLTEEDDRVALAEHDLNQRMSTYAFALPLDPDYASQWHLHTDLNHPDFDPRASSRCEDAWRLLDGAGSQEVVVAVADDGCKLDHPDFDSGAKFASWGYFRGQRLITDGEIDAVANDMYQPGSNHGTSCCGVVAGEMDSVLSVGAAAGVRLLPIKWESSGPSLFISDSKLITTLDFIADKVDVMSNSWGSSPTSIWAVPVLNRIRALSETGGRRGKGIVFLWAAGNENCPIEHQASVDVPFTNGWRRNNDGSWTWVGVRTARQFRHNLADLEGVMHIGALASTGQRSHYSNYGTGVTLSAPSSNSHAYARATVRGLGVTTATGSGSGVTHGFGGTSSATPLVAGIAALTISANPSLSAAEVIAILKQTASKNVDFTGYARTAPANFDPDPRWDVSPVAPFDDGTFRDTGDADGSWSPWFGHGRVDARAAVSAALSRLPQRGGDSFHGESAPDRSIPDNSIQGIKDRIECDADLRIRDLRIDVEVTHTYIGDLRISLLAPDGNVVVLHDRSGGSTNDLSRRFDALDVPGLLAMKGASSEGKWTLHVQDLARIDRGRLRRWSLDITGDPDPLVLAEDAPGVIIPDAGHPITRTVNVSGVGSLAQIKVDVDITHTYIGDLVVELLDPGNERVLLHDRVGGSLDNIIRTYDSASTAALQPLLGRSFAGNWTLRVSDHAALDQGKLNRWALTIVPG